MRILALGDTHGRSAWKQHIEKQNPDKIIFIGDYFDNGNIQAHDQRHNFEDIIELKKSRPDDVILILGNHDLHYLIDEEYSGYQWQEAPVIEKLLRDNINLLQWAHSQNGFLFTHAGVTKSWCKNNGIVQGEDIAEQINQLPTHAFRFVGDSFYGDDIIASPVWVRPRSLAQDKIDDWTLVVGHTRQENIDPTNNKTAIFIDAIEKGQALVITTKKGEVNFETSQL